MGLALPDIVVASFDLITFFVNANIPASLLLGSLVTRLHDTSAMSNPVDAMYTHAPINANELYTKPGLIATDGNANIPAPL